MLTVKVVSPANLGTEFTQVAPKIGLNLDASLVKAATGQIGLNRSVGIKRASQQASGTTLVNDAQLFLAMTPGYWLADVFLKYTAGGRNDLKFDFNVESGAMAGTWQVDRSDNGTGNSTSAAIQLTSYALNNVFVAGGNGAVQNLVMMRGVI